MLFKNKIKNLVNLYRTLKDPKDGKNFFISKLTLKNIIILGLITNFGSLFILIPLFNDSYLNLSITRFISRIAGNVGNLTIPVFLREKIYKSYCKFYNVNQEEILDKELKNYTTVKDFFIRKIELDRRPIEDMSDKILSSPCDGRLFSFSEIKNFDEMFFVKQTKDSLSNFLYGEFTNNHPGWRLDLLDENKRYYQMTIYLSPGDCHRYYSPANIKVSERIYIPGFLVPVKPSYVLKHPKAFSMNERVTLRCKYTNPEKNDILYISFVGALNVGSINLSFDDYLSTNSSTNLADLKEEAKFILKYSDILQKNYNFVKEVQKFYYNPVKDELDRWIMSELEEFDPRDILDFDQDIVKDYGIDVEKLKIKVKDYVENSILDIAKKKPENLKYNIYNHFLNEDMISFKIRKNLKNPKKLKIEDFKISDEGVLLSKKDEMGWFNFGSTIVLVFSNDKNEEIVSKFLPGEQIKIGQSLIEIKH